MVHQLHQFELLKFDLKNIEEDSIILIGVISGLVYFFFSKEHKGIIGKVSRVGVYFLMIKFGASFGLVR